MKLIAFEIYSYCLPTTLGFDREGLIVRLVDESGREGVGEITPLPGRSYETLKEALLYTKQIRERFLMGDLKPALFPPSVLFGMEMALSDLLFPLKEDLSFKVYSNKLKLKNLSISEAVSVCKESEGPLRIDLNQAWNLSKTVEFCSHFKPADILYIEEPVSEFTDLEKFYEMTKFPYAVDEQLSRHPIQRIASLKGLTHIVIKPTLHGGLHQCRELIEKTPHLKHVFSSAYETGIGLRHIAKIGSSLAPNEPIGIDTHSIYPEKLISFNPQNQIIEKDFRVAWKKLKKIV